MKGCGVSMGSYGATGELFCGKIYSERLHLCSECEKDAEDNKEEKK